MMKFIYKIFYFYGTPLFIIWMSFLGFNYWQIQDKLDNNKQIRFKILSLTPINEKYI